MKRLLIVTYYWPPTGGSGVQRWVKFSKYLPLHGWQPVVYTPENPERLATDESLLSEIPECTEVLKTRILEPYSAYRKFFGVKPGGGEVNPVSSNDASLKKRISLWIRGNMFIPDPRVFWVRPSVKFLKRYLAEHPVDAVVTTGPPQSMHLIGLELKKALGLPWIADFRDPWTQMFYYKHLGLNARSDRKHHELERAVLDAADRVIAVTPSVRDDFRALTSTPVELITNGYDEEDFSGPLPERKDGSFRVVHTGLFAADGNPLALWEALAEMCKRDSDFRKRLQIRLSGKTDAAILQAVRDAGLGDNLLDLGYLPHSGITGEQRSADILLLPLRREPEYAKVLPGKIFEYIASGRPVLGTGQPDGEAARLLRESGAGDMFDWDDVAGPTDFLSSSRTGAADCSRFSRRVLTEKLVEVLDDITSKNRI